ncbi:MAG: DUF551 domain-containing protein [Desulfobulbia bacterium]
MSEWISVEDRLPESEGMYLCYSENGIQQVVYSAARYERYSEHFMPFNITHWMPLPEPPED